LVALVALPRHVCHYLLLVGCQADISQRMPIILLLFTLFFSHFLSHLGAGDRSGLVLGCLVSL
jgi:hypothetical protein